MMEIVAAVGAQNDFTQFGPVLGSSKAFLRK